MLGRELTIVFSWWGDSYCKGNCFGGHTSSLTFLDGEKNCDLPTVPIHFSSPIVVGWTYGKEGRFVFRSVGKIRSVLEFSRVPMVSNRSVCPDGNTYTFNMSVYVGLRTKLYDNDRTYRIIKDLFPRRKGKMWHRVLMYRLRRVSWGCHNVFPNQSSFPPSEDDSYSVPSRRV